MRVHPQNFHLRPTTFQEASAGSERLSFCEAQDYDLIVLDVNLPDGNGFDFCMEIKEHRPDTAVI